VCELDDSFTALLGRQPTDKEKQALYRVRDALKLKATDAVWLLLMALQHYETLYERVPARMAAAVKDVTNAVRSMAEAEAKAAQETARKALMAAVQNAAVKSASKAAGAHLARWVSIAGCVVCASVIGVGWKSFRAGQEKGMAVGENITRRQCGALVAASSWANTPEGRLAYAFSRAGGLGEVARCAGRGMVLKDGWCLVPSDRGKTLARWSVPAGRTSATGDEQ
jgi:hypothetical protein